MTRVPFLAASVAVLALLVPPALRADETAPAPAVTVPTWENPTCPIMGRPVSKAQFTDTEFGRIYVCCPPCVAKVKADPERASKVAYPGLKKANNDVCPITGKKIEAEHATVVLQGIEVNLSSTDAVAAAKAEAQVVLAKATNAKVVDVGNRTCPITGKPVAPNAYCLVGTDLIRLASPSAVDEVKKDPATALKKAKEIAAAQK